MTKRHLVPQQLAPASAVPGAPVPTLRALAERVEELVVLTDSAAEGALPDNVTIRTFNASRRAGRGMRFESALARELSRRPRPSAVLAHMCPIYAVLAAPLARPTGVKVLLWFTHWRRSALLSTATRASSKVLSVDKRTFPIKTRKLVAIGHGIDVSDLPCVKRPEDREPFTLLALGRTSPAKGLVTILRAVEQAELDHEPVERDPVHPLLFGEGRPDDAESHLGHLLDRVDISGPVPRQAIPSLYADVDTLVNDMREGAADKVVYEAAATCLPVIASNHAFDTLLPERLRFEHGNPESLADAIRFVLEADRQALGRTLHGTVTREHSVDVWADRVVELAG